MISEPLPLTRFFFLMVISPELVFINPHEPTSNSETTLVAFKVGSQLPLKLTFSKINLWRARLMSLLISYDLQGYIDNTIVCSSSTLPPNTSSDGLASVDVPNPVFWH